MQENARLYFMKGISRFLWLCYQCFVLYTLLVYALVYWVPFSGWIAGFLMMSLPVVLIIQLVSVAAWFVVDRKKALLPILMLLLGSVFLPRTFAFGKKSEVAESRSFTVMSYNAHSFMLNLVHKHDGIKQDIDVMKEWVRDAGADVICLPEYYDDVTRVFNVKEVLSGGGYRYSRFYRSVRKENPSKYLGLAIYSKYPIVASHDTVFMAQNGMIRADIKISGDTVRVIGLHLYSMTLNLHELARQKRAGGVVKEGKITLRKIKTGFTERASELDVIRDWIGDSKYPVIVCGDFNEMPYGYVYGQLRKNLLNAFEEKGKGFGFTFNQAPYFIRIDHQFFDPRLRILDFETNQDVKYSDHYPISATYTFTKDQ